MRIHLHVYVSVVLFTKISDQKQKKEENYNKMKLYRIIQARRVC